jgi:glycosidase
MNTIKFLTLSILILMISCKSEKENAEPIIEETIDFVLPEWAKADNIYEVNIRQYTPEGTFKAFEAHLPRLKEMGADILWLMPIFPISEEKRKGPLGSYYAVSDFREVNPQFGTKQDMIDLIKSIHASGMKIILDWVPNHTGWDHTWISTHPEYYTQDADGNIIDPIDPATGESWGWTDVADLNYDNKDMRVAMIEDLEYWITEMGIDGYRMDVAHGVPFDFWQEVATSLTTVKPDVFLLAEAEIPQQLNENTFHACYGWAFHHILNDIAKGEKNVGDIRNWLANEKVKFQKGNLMHFTSNHDENSWAGTEETRMGEGVKAFAVLVSTFDGIPLVYSGQEEPLTRMLKFFEKDDIEFKDYAYADFYKSLLTLKHDHKALWNAPYGGDLTIISDSDHVFAFKREKDGDEVTVIINLSKENQSIELEESISGTELFSKQPVTLDGTVELTPYQYYVIY